MMTDPIADMLTRIRNASLARHDRAEMPHSRLKEHVADVLKAEGFIDDVRVSEGDGPKTLTLVLRYGRDRSRAIDGIAPRLDARAAASTSATTASPRVLLGHGRLDPQHEPRRDDRPRGAQAARRRRAPLRGLVSAMTTQADADARATTSISRGSASARSRCPKGVTATIDGRQDRGQGAEGQLSRDAPAERRREGRGGQASPSCRRSAGATARASRGSRARSSAAWSRAWPRATRRRSSSSAPATAPR